MEIQVSGLEDGWTDPGFDDETWRNGDAQVGFGQEDLAEDGGLLSVMAPPSCERLGRGSAHTRTSSGLIGRVSSADA